ncbi:MAG: hypothetical protein WDO71_22155 [Bacteroidota bacterium]
MIKLAIGAVIVVVAGVAWLRTQWAMDKNKRAAHKLIEGLKSGALTVASFEESLGMLIRVRQLPENIHIASFSHKLTELTNTKLLEKFTVHYVTINDNNKGIVIAEAVKKDTVSVASNKETDIIYPCWLYLEIIPSQREICFRSSMPDGKDHHHLLEDISDAIYEQCLK